MAFDARLLSGIGTLVAVAEMGSFALAADALGLTPSGVSRSVSRLETRLGVRLFERSARATSLTEAGTRMLAEVAPLLAGIGEAAGRAAGETTRVRGRLRINCDPWFARLLLVPRLRTFLVAHPDLTLDLVMRDTLGDLVGEGFDAAIRFGEPQTSNLVTRKLLDTRIVTCAAPDYIARHGRPEHPQDLASEHHTCLLFRDPTTGRPFGWEFHGAGKVLEVKVQGRLILNEGATAVAACLAGLGIAQPMELGLEDALRDGRLVELFPDWQEERFPLHVYYPSRHLCPAKLRAFLDFVVKEVVRVAPEHRIPGAEPPRSNPVLNPAIGRHETMTKTLKAGDKVKWDTPQGETHGEVVKKVTGTSKAGGHVAKASKDEPQFRVKSDKSGKEAVHKPEELKKA